MAYANDFLFKKYKNVTKKFRKFSYHVKSAMNTIQIVENKTKETYCMLLTLVIQMFGGCSVFAVLFLKWYAQKPVKKATLQKHCFAQTSELPRSTRYKHF